MDELRVGVGGFPARALAADVDHRVGHPQRLPGVDEAPDAEGPTGRRDRRVEVVG